jgi:hypothetical protein
MTAYRVACLVLGTLGALLVLFGSRLDVPDPPEAEVLKTCLALLRAHGVFAWRNNVGAVVAEYKGRKRCVRFGFAGASDILGVLPGGRFLAVETKRRGEKPRPEQIEFLRLINQSGGVAVWVDDPRHLERVLPFILRGARVAVDDDGGLTVEVG